MRSDPLADCVPDPQHIADTRAGIPLLTQRRFDLYPDILAVAEGTAQ